MQKKKPRGTGSSDPTSPSKTSSAVASRASTKVEIANTVARSSGPPKGTKINHAPRSRPKATTHELLADDDIESQASDGVDVDLLRQCLADYEEVNGLLLSKVKKLETLVKLKDKRLLALERKCTDNGIKSVSLTCTRVQLTG
jgi:hypothetical protein